MPLKISFHIPKKKLVLIACALIVAVAALIFYSLHATKTPLPANLKDHVAFRVIYPTTTKASIDKNSFVYQSGQKVLTYNSQYLGKKVVFSEQRAPEALGVSTQPYYPALGLHPYAQFKTKLGEVALTKFWQAGSFKPSGQSAVLSSNGTLLIAHSEKSFTNNEWKNLFESLKITK
jgi:hypothetical protein